MLTTLIGAALLGLIMGSFLTMLIPRLHNDEKGIFMGRSHCSECKTTLKVYELVPFFSFMIQLGKCRHCEAKIKWWYPLIELTTALMFVWIAVQFNTVSEYIWHVLIFSILLFIFFYDLRYKEIHDAVMLPGILIALLYSIFLGDWRSSLIAAGIATVFFGGQWLLSRGRWIGIGDLRIGIFMGLFLGWMHLLFAILSGYIFGSFISIILLASGSANRETALPLGPFLVVGTMLAYLYGDQFITWYLNI